MSNVKNWTYIFDATVWHFMPGDGWEIPDSYSEPVHIRCNYKGESKIYRNQNGDEITSTMTFSTEYDNSFEDDLIMLGIHTDMPPRGAKKIMAITRSSDIFKVPGAVQKDDYKLVT